MATPANRVASRCPGCGVPLDTVAAIDLVPVGSPPVNGLRCAACGSVLDGSVLDYFGAVPTDRTGPAFRLTFEGEAP